jgi:hypothetical protein
MEQSKNNAAMRGVQMELLREESASHMAHDATSRDVPNKCRREEFVAWSQGEAMQPLGKVYVGRMGQRWRRNDAALRGVLKKLRALIIISIIKRLIFDSINCRSNIIFLFVILIMSSVEFASVVIIISNDHRCGYLLP